jgi:serine/threonine protein kinase/tetratricopeptide (TPR) repeat protein
MLGRTISHYRILEKQGEGGMGVVYKAEDTRLKRTVALKFLPPDLTRDTEAKERFIREAQTASALEHSNICTIYEINETEDGQLFICMAYCDGEELKKKIERGPLKIDETIDIAIQVTEGLREAHDKGIIHRDIKSGNIMVTTKGQAKIMDFGLAKLAGRTTLTKTGSTMGTIAYMSPEQARGEKVDNQTDIWSLGVVLYEMLTGQLPFKSEYEQAVIYSILNKDPQPIIELNKNVPESLDIIVKKALEKDPDHRYQNAGELLTDLRAVKSGFEVVKRPGIKRKISQAILFSLALVLAFILIFLFVRYKEKQIPRKIPIGVMFFDNQTGEDKYDYLRKVLADLLITDLSTSRYLKVMTFPEMLDGLKSLGCEEVKIIADSLWFKLCKLKGVQVMVLGSLTKSGDTFVLNSRLLNVDTKKQIATPYKVKDKGEDSILGHLVDDLTDKIKRGIKISMKEIQAEKKDIAELTTTSLEAYQYYFAGGEAAYRMYNPEAIDNLEKAVAIDSTFVEAYSALARQYYTIGDNTMALKIIDKTKTIATNYGKGTEETLVGILALEAYIKQDWDLAINYYKRLISLNPENIGAHLDLGTVYYQKKRMYDEGISEFKKILELDPQGVTSSSSFAYNLLGWAYLRKEEWKKALGAFNKYVALLPNQAYPLDVLAEINLVVGDYDQAITNLQRSLEIKPDYPVTSALLGDVNLAKGMYSQAMRFYERYLALPLSEVKQAEGRLNLSNLYFLKGEYDQAVQECQKALELDPQMIKAHWIRGLTFLKKEMFEQADSEVLAIKGLIEETKAEDLRTNYYHLLGELFLCKGINQQALANLNQAATIWSLDRTYYLNALGEAYFKIGELNKAKEKFEDVFEINPNYAQTHYLLGQLYQKQGKKDKARGHLQKFVEIWKNADENLPQLIDAKRRLAGL